MVLIVFHFFVFLFQAILTDGIELGDADCQGGDCENDAGDFVGRCVSSSWHNLTHGDTGQAVFHGVLPKKEKIDWFVFFVSRRNRGSDLPGLESGSVFAEKICRSYDRPMNCFEDESVYIEKYCFVKTFFEKSTKSPFSRDFILFFWKIFCKFSIRGYSMETIWEQFSDVGTPFLLTIKRYCLFLTCPHETNYPHSSLKTYETNH